MSKIVSRQFYSRPALLVARELLGKKIVRIYDGTTVSGMISETEAYVGPEDTACHASKGKTPRNEVMFGPPGHAYVYFVYGMHHMLNFVTGKRGFPAAVLIRGIVPLTGIEKMIELRGRSSSIADGPGKLCRALAVDRSLNGSDLTGSGVLRVEEYGSFNDGEIAAGPRIGINYAEPKDRDAAYRFRLLNSRPGGGAVHG
jgi:DNA-3-methyladenine glycosylase